MGDKCVVTGDQYISIDRKVGDIKRQLLTKGGSPLDPDQVDQALQRICEGNFGIPDLFVSIHRQIKNIERWNGERDWGLDEALENLPLPPIFPDTTDEEFTGAVVLVPYLMGTGLSGTASKVSGTSRTLRELWTVVGYQHSGAYWGEIDPALAQLQPEPNLLAPPTLRWEVIDLGANRGRPFEDVRDERPLLPSAGILAAAAHFPEWVKRMDGKDVPFVAVPGWDYSRSSSAPEALCLSKPKGIPAELCLDVTLLPRLGQQFAIPVITQTTSL